MGIFEKRQSDSYLYYLLNLNGGVDVDSIGSVVAQAVDGAHR